MLKLPESRAFSFAIVLFVLVGATMVGSSVRYLSTSSEVRQSLQRIETLNDVETLVLDLDSATPATDASADLDSVILRVRHDLAGEPETTALVDALVARKKALGTVSHAEAGELTAKVRKLVDDLDEHDVLHEREATSARAALIEIAAQIVALIVGSAIMISSFRRLRRENDRRRASETAARVNEESLSTTMNSIGDAVIATDANLRVVRMNPVAERLTGWSAAEAHGRPLHDVWNIVDEVSRQPATEIGSRVMATNQIATITEPTILIAKDGSELPVGDSAAPIRDSNGKPIGVVIVFRDATMEREQRRLSEQLQLLTAKLERRVEARTHELSSSNDALIRETTERQKSEEQLRQAQKLEGLGQLAGGIAHDFNNLLSVILGFAETAMEDSADENTRSDLNEVCKAAMRAAELTRQLLAFSRRQVLAPKVLDMNAVVGNMEKLLNRVIGESIDLRVSAHATAPVEVDPGQIEQVIVNLIVNARDAMPSGGTVTIETSDVDVVDATTYPGVDAGRYILLAVRDTGTGMDRATIDRIFEPFFTTKAPGKGTGLGLSTVFGIVKQSRGTIVVESDVGRGTTFKILLPVAVAVAERNSVRMIGLPSELQGSETILLVEDETCVRDLVQRMLERAGYKVLQARNGVEALRTWDVEKPSIDLLLTDVVMPHMSGRVLAEEFALRSPETLTLFMSGYTDDMVVHHGVMDNTMTLLQKPITRDALLRQVRKMLDAVN